MEIVFCILTFSFELQGGWSGLCAESQHVLDTAAIEFLFFLVAHIVLWHGFLMTAH